MQTTYSTFPTYMVACDRVLNGTIGLTHRDICDAPWYDYYESDLRPEEAVASALVEYNDMDVDTLWSVGLGDYY